MAKIKADHLHATYRVRSVDTSNSSLIRTGKITSVKALSGVSFTLEDGDRLGVIGKNGSGKSTLLKVLSGTLPHSKGKLDVEGDILSLLSRTTGLNKRASLSENARLKAFSLGLKGQEVEDFVFSSLAAANLFEKKDLPLRSLSAGMSGRFNLAMNAQVFKPITILDEWVSTLDAFQSSEGGTLEALSETVKILIVASHNEELIRKICNKVILLDGGKIRYFGNDFDQAFNLFQTILKPELPEFVNSDDQKEHVTNSSHVGIPEKHQVHLLRYSKTAGHALKALLHGFENENYVVTCHDFNFPLRKIPQGEQVIFFYRDPIERFARMFDARKNQGGPFYYSPWSQPERSMFKSFETAEALLEALISAREDQRLFATRCLMSIEHLKSSASTVLGDLESLRVRARDIMFLGCADTLSESVEELSVLLTGDNRLVYQFKSLPHSDYLMNSLSEKFGEKHRAVLAQLFSEEIRYIEHIRTQLGEQRSKH